MEDKRMEDKRKEEMIAKLLTMTDEEIRQVVALLRVSESGE